MIFYNERPTFLSKLWLGRKKDKIEAVIYTYKYLSLSLSLPLSLSLDISIYIYSRVCWLGSYRGHLALLRVPGKIPGIFFISNA